MKRRKRLKVSDPEKGAVYHVVSRTVNKEFLWDEKAKEILRRQIYKVAAFCGVEVLAYCVLSNHFHLLVKVIPNQSARLTNEQLLERCARLYNNPKDGLVLADIQSRLHSDNEQKRLEIRQQLLARMDDISPFMKILKQRFSIWFNRTHQRWGTHWGERFQSVLVQPSSHALLAVAAYIALNPLRAGLCKDPKDYRFSSYTEAVAGYPQAVAALMAITGEIEARLALSTFRNYLFAVGVLPKRQGEAAVIDAEEARKVRARAGCLAPTDIWKVKCKFFTQGLALGSQGFLEELIANGLIWKSRRTFPKPLEENNWVGLSTLR